MDTAPQTVTIVVPAEALIGLEKVQIHRNADVVSDIRSNGKVKVERGNGADDPGTIQGSIQTTGDVQILRDNVISGDVTAGGRVRLHRSVIVEDAFGRQVSSGVYFYKIVAGRHQDTRRMVFAK